MTPFPFQPKRAGTIRQANATSAASGTLDSGCDTVVLYNSSATATAFWACQVLSLDTDTGPTATVPGASAGDMPIPPGAQVRVSVGTGPKKYSVIASAADGYLYITPGRGN